jgi:hypothetical protein
MPQINIISYYICQYSCIHLQSFARLIWRICPFSCHSMKWQFLSWNYVKVDTFSCTEQFSMIACIKPVLLHLYLVAMVTWFCPFSTPFTHYLRPPPSISIHSPYSLSHLQCSWSSWGLPLCQEYIMTRHYSSQLTAINAPTPVKLVQQ